MTKQVKTLSLKTDRAALARMKLEAHERTIGMKPAREPPPQPESAQGPEPLSAPAAPAAAEDKKPRKPLPQRPIDWGVTLDLDASDRQTRMEQLQGGDQSRRGGPGRTEKHTRPACRRGDCKSRTILADWTSNARVKKRRQARIVAGPVSRSIRLASRALHRRVREIGCVSQRP